MSPMWLLAMRTAQAIGGPDCGRVVGEEVLPVRGAIGVPPDVVLFVAGEDPALAPCLDEVDGTLSSGPLQVDLAVADLGGGLVELRPGRSLAPGEWAVGSIEWTFTVDDPPRVFDPPPRPA